MVGAAGLVLSVSMHGNVVMSMAGLTLATMGIMATLPVFWGLPTGLLGGGAAAAGIALINSCGNLSGFAAPFAIGMLGTLRELCEKNLWQGARWVSVDRKAQVPAH